MTCPFEIYQKAGGDFHVTGPVTLNKNTTPTTIIAGVVGKRIVPIWLVFSYQSTGSASLLRFSVGGDVSVRYLIYANAIYTHNRITPYVYDFKGNEARTFVSGENIVSLFSLDYSSIINNPRMVAGYYLLDA